MSYATEEQLQELAAFMASKINVPTIGVGGGYAPIGTIIQYMGVTAPQDYLICDGTVYNIADYSQLADFFEAQFGSKNKFGGDGNTTFAVPDLRGEFLRGTGTNSHTNQGSGSAVGTHQDSTLIPETFSNSVNINSTTLNGEEHYKNNDGYIKNSDGAKARAITAASRFDEWGYGDAVRPTNTSVLYCIKAVVAGEVYSTEERVVGTWIDGKKLYQKTVDCGALPNNTSKNVTISNSSDIEKVIYITGVAYRTTDNLAIPIPRARTVNDSDDYDIDVAYMGLVSEYPGALAITTKTNYSNFDKTYITIRYTKTTD